MNCKPGYVSDGHLSSPAVAGRLKRPTRTVRIHKIRRRAAGLSCSVLLRMGFTYAPRVTARAVVSCTAFAPLPAFRPAVIFCCTFLGVASTGRYPASCPVKPGLSSPAPFRDLQPRPSALLISLCILLAGLTVVNFYASKHPPPTNSLSREFVGTEAVSTPTKYSRNLRSLLAS